jgi:hypothetical protein
MAQVSTMKYQKHNHPGWGWIALAVLVAAADTTGERTMSDAFREASRHPVLGPPVIAGWCVLTAHLLGYLPPRLDPFHRLTCYRGRCVH